MFRNMGSRAWEFVRKLPGYKLYYNESKINRADGVIIYVSEEIDEVTEIIKIGNLKILNSTIKMNNNKKVEISSLYRSHRRCLRKVADR